MAKPQKKNQRGVNAEGGQEPKNGLKIKGKGSEGWKN